MAGSNFDPQAYARAQRNIQTVIEAGKAGMVRALPTIGLQATNVVKVMVTKPSPSAPGGPPGLVHGGLRLSYGFEVGGEGERHWVSIGSDASTRRPITGEEVDYPKYLEEGTSHMAPRPHFRPAMAIVLPTIPATLRMAAETSMRAAAASLRVV